MRLKHPTTSNAEKRMLKEIWDNLNCHKQKKLRKSKADLPSSMVISEAHSSRLTL
jgi:hypothetical protein